MKRILKAALLAAVALACLGGLGLLAINLYVQSPGSQARLREAVTEYLGYPVSVFRTSVDPWTGVHLQGVTIQDPSAGYPILQAQDLWIRCALFPLLKHKVIIRQIFLSGADFRIPIATHQKPEPRTTETLAEPEPAPSEAEAPENSAPTPNATPEKAKSEAPLVKGSPVPVYFSIEFRKFKIRHATVSLIGGDGETAAKFSEVEGAIEARERHFEGKIRIANASVSNSLNLDDISSPVRYADGAVDLKDISARLSGGEIRGSFHANLTDPELPYQIDLQVSGVNVNQFVGRAGGILDRAHGTLQGGIQLAGSMKDPSLAAGDGSVEIQTGYLDQFPILKELGRWTQIDELQRIDLERAWSKFRVIGQDIKVNSLQLVSKNCEVNLSGTVDSAQKLDLNGRLTLSQFLTQKIPSELEDNFEKSMDGDGSYVDFQVTGSVSKPQTDLIDRIIGDRGKLLRKIFRLDRKEKESTPDGVQQFGTPSNG